MPRVAGRANNPPVAWLSAHGPDEGHVAARTNTQTLANQFEGSRSGPDQERSPPGAATQTVSVDRATFDGRFDRLAISHSHVRRKTWAMVRDDAGEGRRPLDLAKARILGAVDRALQKKAVQINRAGRITDQIMDHDPIPVNRMNANRTGLKDGLDALKQRAAAAKAKAAMASEKVSAAFDKQEQASVGLETYATEIEREADEVLSELGQFSNGGPK